MITSFLGGVLNLPLWLQMTLFIVFIVGGFIALIKGADAFVSGASGIAKKLKVPAIIIGLTIVSIGTSLPEASVSISSAINKSADLSIGNVVGSNMFNTLVVLGFSLVFVAIALKKNVIFKDMLLMLISSILLLVFALFGNDANGNVLGRIECGILFAIFVGYIIYSVIDARKASKLENTNLEIKQENTNEENNSTIAGEENNSIKPNNMGKNILLLLIGLIGIVIGGDLVVFGAKNFAINVGMSEILVGLTIVAVGTSLPELVTSIVAAKKKENEIALGNVIGSNMFNILFILGMTGLITPLSVSANVLIDIIIMTVLFIFVFIFSVIKKNLPRFLGYIFLLLYIAYLAYIILRDFVFL